MLICLLYPLLIDVLASLAAGCSLKSLTLLLLHCIVSATCFVQVCLGVVNDTDNTNSGRRGLFGYYIPIAVPFPQTIRGAITTLSKVFCDYLPSYKCNYVNSLPPGKR